MTDWLDDLPQETIERAVALFGRSNLSRMAQSLRKANNWQAPAPSILAGKTTEELRRSINFGPKAVEVLDFLLMECGHARKGAGGSFQDKIRKCDPVKFADRVLQ